MADRSNYVNNAPMGLRDHLADETEYSHMVWLTGGSVNLLDADIQMGAVEIKDHDSAIRLDVETVTAKNALFDQSEDGAHETTGAIADSIVAAGATGTISAKLRRLTSDAGSILAAVQTSIYAEDSPHGTEDEGTFVLAVRNDSGSAMAGDGDYSVFMVDANGRLYVNAEALDKDTDEVLIWANTVKDGSGTDYVPLVDNDGHLQIDVLTSSGSIVSLPSDTFVAEDGALGKGVLLQGDDGTDRKNVQVNPDGDIQFHSNWAPSLQVDETADDSDKEFTVTVGKEWHLMWLWVEFTSGSVAGNRQIEVQLKDNADDVIMQLQSGVTQATGLTYNYLFAPGCADLTALRDTTYLTTPIPPTIIFPASYDIRVWDNNAVAAAEDDMTLQMMVLERTA